jgi:hypothetical protein
MVAFNSNSNHGENKRKKQGIYSIEQATISREDRYIRHKARKAVPGSSSWRRLPHIYIQRGRAF